MTKLINPGSDSNKYSEDLHDKLPLKEDNAANGQHIKKFNEGKSGTNRQHNVKAETVGKNTANSEHRGVDSLPEVLDLVILDKTKAKRDQGSKKVRKKFFLLIPQKEICDLVIEFCDNDKLIRNGRKSYSHKYFWFLQRIASNKYGRPVKSGFVSISAKELYDNGLKNCFKTMISFFEGLGLVEVNNSYRVGFYAKSFQLNPKVVFNGSYVEIDDARTPEDLSSLNPGYTIYRDGLGFLTLDKSACLKTIEDFYNSINGSDLALCRKRNSYLQAVAIFDNKHFHIDSYGRCHTNLTNLPGILRRHLKFKNESLGQIDISASQFVFLNLYLKDQNIDQCELERFERLVFSGKFYEHLMAKSTKPIPREIFKQGLFKNIFFKKEYYKAQPTEYERIFQVEFPNIYNWILENRRKHGYKFLVKPLQSGEANFMFEFIEYANERGVPANLLIHDAVVVPVNLLTSTKDLLIEFFELKHGKVPFLKVEVFK